MKNIIIIQKEFESILKCSKAKMISLQYTVVAKILRYILGVLGLFFDQINKFSDYSNVSTFQLGALHLHRILRICLNLVQKRLDWNPDQNWAKCPAMVYYLRTIFTLSANLNRSERNIYDAGVTKPFYLTSFEKMSYKLRPLTVGKWV